MLPFGVTLKGVTEYHMEILQNDWSLTFFFSFSVCSYLLLTGLQAMVSKIKASFTDAGVSFFTY